MSETETGRAASGARLVEWAAFATVWAERIAPKGLEVFDAQQKAALVSCVYRIRYRDDVSPVHRLKDLRDNRTYDIKAVTEPFGRMQTLDLAATARAEAAA